MSKIQARDTIFKLVYEYNFIKEYNQISLDKMTVTPELNEEERQYVYNTYKDILEKNDTILEIIKSHLEKYTIDKVTKMDLAILTVAIYEIEYDESITYKVAINEAVELAKKYSNDNSYKFINGVLARIIANKE